LGVGPVLLEVGVHCSGAWLEDVEVLRVMGGLHTRAWLRLRGNFFFFQVLPCLMTPVSASF